MYIPPRSMLNFGDADEDGALNFEEFKTIYKMPRTNDESESDESDESG